MGGSMKSKGEVFLHKKELSKRIGWNHKTIDDFLGDPDKTKPNRFNSNHPIQYYSLKRIEKVEKTAAFKKRKEKNILSQKRGEKSVETQTKKLEDYINSLEIKIPLMDDDVLIKYACNHHNIRAQHGQFVTPESDEDELHRITVNYLRHECSQYEIELEGLYGKVGRGDAYLELADRVFDEIEKQYEWLGPECRRPSAKKWKQASFIVKD
jgi:hypothetical protein